MHFSPYLLACTFLAFAFYYELHAHVFSFLTVHLTLNAVRHLCSNNHAPLTSNRFILFTIFLIFKCLFVFFCYFVYCHI